MLSLPHFLLHYWICAILSSGASPANCSDGVLFSSVVLVVRHFPYFLGVVEMGHALRSACQ